MEVETPYLVRRRFYQALQGIFRVTTGVIIATRHVCDSKFHLRRLAGVLHGGDDIFCFLAGICESLRVAPRRQELTLGVLVTLP